MSMQDLYQAVIVDHGRHPRNFYADEKATYIKTGDNPLCGDTLTLYITEDNGVIKSISFKGEGCAISMASTSLMTSALQGKTLQEAKSLFKAFHAMVVRDKGEQSECINHAEVANVHGDLDKSALGKLQALAGVAEYPMRVKCATLPWHTLMGVFDGVEGTVTTEVGEPPFVDNMTTREPVITFTPTAIAHIKSMLNSQENAIGFRLSLKKSGCSGYMYVPDIIQTPIEDDIHFLEQDIPVYIDSVYVPILQGTVVDFIRKELGQKQIVFHNPHAQNACGCGESFNVNDN